MGSLTITVDDGDTNTGAMIMDCNTVTSKI